MKKHWRVCIRRWASKKPVRAGTGRDFPRYMQAAESDTGRPDPDRGRKHKRQMQNQRRTERWQM